MSNSASAGPVLLLGLDGLGFEFLRSPLVQETAPNLRDLLAGATSGVLHSTLPPYTAPAWTSITTGVGPGRHGIFGFTDARGRAVSDGDVRAPRLWDHVGQAGGRSVVVNVPITYPPRPIDGVLVSGMPVPPGRAFTHPAGLGAELTGRGYVVDVAVAERAHDGPAVLERLRRMTEARGRCVGWLARRETWDLFAVVFVLPDRLGHPWWKELVPGDSQYATRRAEGTRAAARACLEALDRAVGDLLAAVPAGTTTVVCSDHGFGPLRAEVFFDLVLAGAGLTGGDRPGPVRRAVAAAGRSPLVRLAPAAVDRGLRRRWAGSSRRDGWRAWTTPPFESGVRLEDGGAVAVAESVTALLRDLRDKDGAPVVAEVLRRGDLYHGPFVEDAPDLICRMADESVVLHDGFHASRPWVARARRPWGTHRVDGVVAVTGEAAAGPVSGEAVDVAATVLALLGIGDGGLDGRSLVPPRGERVRRAAPPEPAPVAGDVYSPEEEEAVMNHLRGLGYVD